MSKVVAHRYSLKCNYSLAEAIFNERTTITGGRAYPRFRTMISVPDEIIIVWSHVVSLPSTRLYDESLSSVI